jgi:hypothetical protein
MGAMGAEKMKAPTKKMEKPLGSGFAHKSHQTNPGLGKS